MVVEDNVNQQGNAEFGFRIKDELVKDEEKIVKIMPEIQKLDRTRLPCLRKIEKSKLFPEVRKVNEFLRKIESKDATEENDFFYLEVALVTKVLEKKIKQKMRRNSLGGKEDWRVKLKNLTQIWGD